MIDFHCHLDLYPDALRLLPEVTSRNEFTLVVTTSPRAWQATSKVFAGYRNIAVGLGLHPEVAERKAGELALLVASIASTGFVGEIGLDGSPQYRSSLPLQEKILSAALAECQRVGGRILSLHSRRAASRVLDLIEEFPRCGTSVLHWFSGTHKELERAIALGCWFSVGPAMIQSSKGMSLVCAMPRERILPETDGPFAQLEGRVLMPWQAGDICLNLAAQWRISAQDVGQQIRQNLTVLFAENGQLNRNTMSAGQQYIQKD